MNRYMAKVNDEHLPSRNPCSWEGRSIFVPKPGPRRVSETGRAGLPQVTEGDEIWICTDVTGPGVAARAKVQDVGLTSSALRISLGKVEPIEKPVALSEFGRVESGSRLISQLQRNRHPDVYLLENDILEEFKKVIHDRLGARSLPPRFDWGEVISRNRTEARRQVQEDRVTTLALRPVREGQTAFRDAVMRLYGGRCVVTGCAVAAAVEAAHILPWTGDPDLDRPGNGLILRRDIHGLFDASLIGLHPQSRRVVIAEALRGSEYEDLEGRQVEHGAAPELVAERHALFAEFKEVRSG